jgi:hypothetical protein
LRKESFDAKIIKNIEDVSSGQHHFDKGSYLIKMKQKIVIDLYLLYFFYYY